MLLTKVASSFKKRKEIGKKGLKHLVLSVLTLSKLIPYYLKHQ